MPDPSIADPLQAFRWDVQPAAATLVHELVEAALERLPDGAALARGMRAGCGLRLGDCLDHLVVASAAGLDEALRAVGFDHRAMTGAPSWYAHPGGDFPAVALKDGEALRLAVAVESVADFLAAHHLGPPIDGPPGAALRRARAWSGYRCELWVVERHGSAGLLPDDPGAERVVTGLRHLEAFRLRHRDHLDLDEGFASLERLVDHAIVECGRDQACELFFAAEREYWQRRNRAARTQRARQDAFGLGWSNHDHHTYRSSRRCFTRLIALFEKLGFRCRERFHPGGGAGWGAQVLDHPLTGVVIFADVDMSPAELRGDFSHQPFAGDPPGRPLGTVGLWCALHGESLFQAGMHHLACAVDFAAAREQLAGAGVASMKPFSELPHLLQCFTEGERWSVVPERLAPLLRGGLITAEQAAQFRDQGALGSHLELVERNQGFKGFNQHGVDEIIAGTDPRGQAHG